MKRILLISLTTLYSLSSKSQMIYNKVTIEDSCKISTREQIGAVSIFQNRILIGDEQFIVSKIKKYGEYECISKHFDKYIVRISRSKDNEMHVVSVCCKDSSKYFINAKLSIR